MNTVQARIEALLSIGRDLILSSRLLQCRQTFGIFIKFEDTKNTFRIKIVA